MRDREYPRDVLRAGNERAGEIAARTLAEVQRLMHATSVAWRIAHTHTARRDRADVRR